jgi:hypothetical protein
LLLAFVRTVILGFSLLETHDQDFYSLLDICLLFDDGGVREPDLLYDWRLTAHQFVLVPNPLRITHIVEVELMLQPTVSLPVYLDVKPPSEAQDQIFITVRHLWVC